MTGVKIIYCEKCGQGFFVKSTKEFVRVVCVNIDCGHVMNIRNERVDKKDE